MAEHDLSRAPLRWHVRSGPVDVAEALAADIAAQAQQALASRGAFAIVLAGGSTPRRLYSLLRGLDTDWRRWHVYFTDERCLPSGDAERNDTMARGAWLDHVTMRREQIHSIPAELGAQAGAEEYRRCLEGVGPFDQTLLGLGEDGHTASLFPDDPRGLEQEAPDALAVLAAPKPPPQRVSLSARRLAAARRVALLATGNAKRDATLQLYRGAPIPAAAVAPQNGVDVWLDEAAAADIRSALTRHGCAGEVKGTM
jgi:6-phosphogluconolactonase